MNKPTTLQETMEKVREARELYQRKLEKFSEGNLAEYTNFVVKHFPEIAQLCEKMYKDCCEYEEAVQETIALGHDTSCECHEENGACCCHMRYLLSLRARESRSMFSVEWRKKNVLWSRAGMEELDPEKPFPLGGSEECECSRIGFEKRDNVWWQICIACGKCQTGMPISCPNCKELVQHLIPTPMIPVDEKAFRKELLILIGMVIGSIEEMDTDCEDYIKGMNKCCSDYLEDLRKRYQ